MKVAHLLLASAICLLLPLVGGFTPSGGARRSRRHINADTLPSTPLPLAARRSRTGQDDASPWKQKPGETEFAYLKRLQQMASSTQDLVIQNTTTTTAADEPQQKKKGYVRAEEWDAQTKRADLSWEERVQFDGQRQGDRFLQNEILRKNIGKNLY